MAQRVLLISEASIATVQLLEQLLVYLAETTDLETSGVLVNEVRSTDFTPATFPVFARSSSPESIWLQRILVHRGIPYGYYIDDNFWLLDPATEIGEHYADRHTRRRLDEMITGAHTVIASTPLLADYLRPKNQHVIQLDSFFDFSLVPELPSVVQNRRRVRGGFAANANRGQDLLPVLDEVLAVLESDEDVEFEIVGIDDGALPRHDRIKWFPYLSSYAEYIDFQRSRGWDFALAPLGSAPSNRYKTDNKFREYAAQGIPGIYQDAPPYATVRDGETGLIAGAARSWRDAMHEYVASPQLRQRVRLAARRDAEARIGLPAVAPSWHAVFAAAPSIGDTPRAWSRLVVRLRVHESRIIHGLDRGRRLFLYGLHVIREDGLPRAVSRTAGFVGRRALGKG